MRNEQRTATEMGHDAVGASGTVKENKAMVVEGIIIATMLTAGLIGGALSDHANRGGMNPIGARAQANKGR